MTTPENLGMPVLFNGIHDCKIPIAISQFSQAQPTESLFPYVRLTDMLNEEKMIWSSFIIINISYTLLNCLLEYSVKDETLFNLSDMCIIWQNVFWTMELFITFAK